MTVPEVGLFADLQHAAAHVEAAGKARPLSGLTELAGADWMAYWLDDDARILWQAGRDDDNWLLIQDHAVVVLAQVMDEAQELLDALADPAAAYPGTESGTEEMHLAALDDLYDIELAALRRGPLRAAYVPAYDVDQAIQRQIDLAKAEVSRLAGLRARHILTRYGRERGAGKKAAEFLRVSPPTIAALLSADTTRRADLRAAARAARENAPPAVNGD